MLFIRQRHCGQPRLVVVDPAAVPTSALSLAVASQGLAYPSELRLDWTCTVTLVLVSRMECTLLLGKTHSLHRSLCFQLPVAVLKERRVW